MANIRTLKLNLLADTTDFARGIKKASGETEGFAGSLKTSMKSLAKSAALAGVAVAGMAVAFGVDAVKAYAEDEKGQRKLQIAIKNTTKATKKQREGVEDYISKISLQYGIVDDKLRPALQRLVQATKSLDKSQKLLPVALDAAAASGKDVEVVAAALAKAYGGNTQSLARLGLGIDKAVLKSGDFNAVMKELTRITGGQAIAAAKSFSGKMAIFKITMDEAKESIGGAILNAIQPFAEKWIPKASTAIQHFVDGLTGKNDNGGLKGAIKDNQASIFTLGEKTRHFFKLLNDNKETLKEVALIIGSIFIGAKAGAAVAAMIQALTALGRALGILKVTAATTAAAEAAATGGASLYAALPAIGAIAFAFGLPALISMFGAKKNPGGQGDISKKVDFVEWYKAQPKTKTKNKGPRKFMADGTSMGSGNTIININGIVDAESARRSIQNVLQQSSIRSAPLNLNGSLI